MGNSNISMVCHRPFQVDSSEIIDQEEETSFNIERRLIEDFNNLDFLKSPAMQPMKPSQKVSKKRESFFKFQFADSIYCPGEQEMQDSIIENEEQELAGSLSSIINMSLLFNSVSHRVKDYIVVRQEPVQNHYRLIKFLSKSEDSEIFEAISKENKKKRRAVKSLNHNKNFSESLENRLEQAIKTIPILDHPNITRLYEIFFHANKIFLVFELLKGNFGKFISNLASEHSKHMRTSNGFEYEDQIKIIIHQILKATNYLHKNKVAHLNINCQNILLGNMKPINRDDFLAKLIGFRHSKYSVDNGLHPIVQPLGIKQADLFIAPEIRNKNSYGLKTDVWDVGIVFLKAVSRLTSSQLKENFKNANGVFERFLQDSWAILKEKYSYENQHGLDLITKMLEPNYQNRITAQECLQHPWFITEELELSNYCDQATQRLMSATKSNNLMSLIENMLVYHNMEQEEMNSISKVFYEVDLDHSGTVQFEELLQHLKNTNTFRNNTQLLNNCLEIIKQVDNDESGTIDFHEFSQIVCNKKKHVKEEALGEIFNQFDKDGDGIITVQELKKNLMGCEIEEIDYYMSNIDEDFDGHITKLEFIKYCMAKFAQQWGKQMVKMTKNSKKSKSVEAKTKSGSKTSSFYCSRSSDQ